MVRRPCCRRRTCFSRIFFSFFPCLSLPALYHTLPSPILSFPPILRTLLVNPVTPLLVFLCPAGLFIAALLWPVSAHFIPCAPSCDVALAVATVLVVN